MPAFVLQSICEGWLTVVKLASYENMARGLLDKYYQYNYLVFFHQLALCHLMYM